MDEGRGLIKIIAHREERVALVIALLREIGAMVVAAGSLRIGSSMAADHAGHARHLRGRRTSILVPSMYIASVSRISSIVELQTVGGPTIEFPTEASVHLGRVARVVNVECAHRVAREVHEVQPEVLARGRLALTAVVGDEIRNASPNIARKCKIRASKCKQALANSEA